MPECGGCRASTGRPSGCRAGAGEGIRGAGRHGPAAEPLRFRLPPVSRSGHGPAGTGRLEQVFVPVLGFSVPGRGCRLDGMKPRWRPMSMAASRMVYPSKGGGRASVKPHSVIPMWRAVSPSSWRKPGAGRSGSAFAARWMSKTRHAMTASKARQRRRSSAPPGRRSPVRVPCLRTLLYLLFF